MSALLTRGEAIRKADAQLRYYLHIAEPESLDDNEWAMRIRELEWIRNEESRNNAISNGPR